MTIATLAKHAINLLYPLQCPSCKTRLDPETALAVCDACAARIRRTPRPYCALCGKTVDTEGDLCPECRRFPRAFDRAWSACLYENALKELIHSFKFGSKLPLEKFLGGLMVDFAREDGNIVKGIDFVTWVPLDTRRLSQRGFNQSQLLACEVAAAFGLTTADTLKKVRSGRKHQNELSREERLRNLEGAFTPLPRAQVAGKMVLLIDDVMTTGATLNECAKTLKSAGAMEVRCLSLARGA